MKYPIHPITKDTAKRIVKFWDDYPQENRLTFTEFTGAPGLLTPSNRDIFDQVNNVSKGALEELAEYRLINISGNHISLFEELRNAAEGDFELTPYYLAQHNLISDKLVELLGDTLLSGNRELKESIAELKDATSANRQSKIASVFVSLGKSLQHGANTGAIIQAIVFLAEILK